MNDKEIDKNGRAENSPDEFGTTRRAVLAASGAVALSGLAGCAALDGLMGRAAEQLVGTTVSSPAAFYAGRNPSDTAAGMGMPILDTGRSSDGRQVFRTGDTDIKHVPATVRAESQEIDLEGWAISTGIQATDYNSVRSNKRRSEWWAAPDDEDEHDPLAAIQDVELELLGHVVTAQDAVGRRDRAEANRALDAFINATSDALRPELDSCGSGICETIRENSDGRKQGVRIARDAVDDGDWDAAARELADVEKIVLGDIERLDDELADRLPGRPRFSDIIEYLRDEPTIGERFTVCLPDASLPGDRGSLAEELTPERVLAYFAASREPDGLRTPFHDRYGSQGISYDDDSCIRIDGPVSLHRDISCGSILSAELDTYRTANRSIVGYSTEGGAVVSGIGRNPQTGKEIQIAAENVDSDGKCVFVAPDGTLREAASLNDGEVQCWGQRRSADDGSLYCWGSNRTADDVSVSETLVCPVSVTPADCPCPLPGLFYVRRCLHDDQVIFAGGWLLDEGALYEDSVTLLFDEGPTEFASVTPADVESNDYDARIVEQFSRDRSRHGSAVASARVQGPDMNKAELIGEMASQVFQTDQGRKGLNAVNVKVVGERGDDGPIHTSVVALDAPLVHLADAAGTGNGVKFKAGAELSKAVN